MWERAASWSPFGVFLYIYIFCDIGGWWRTYATSVCVGTAFGTEVEGSEEMGQLKADDERSEHLD